MKTRQLLILTALLAACGSSQGSQATQATGPTPAPSESADATAAAADTDKRVSLGEITMIPPTGFQSNKPSSPMRLAEFSVGTEPDRAELIAYFFKGGAGSIEANLTRWHGQFEQPDGRPSSEVAKTETKQVNGLNVTITDVSGRFVAPTRPGANDKQDKPGHRMIAAIVETDSGHTYFKFLGPAAVISANAEAFARAIETIKSAAPKNPHGGGSPHSGGSPHDGGGW